MKNTKRIVTVLLAGLMAASGLAACNSQPSASSTAPSASSKAEASSTGEPEKPDTSEEYVLNITIPEQAQDGEKAVEEKLTELMKDKLNVKVELDVIPVDEYKAQMERKFLGNEKVDLVFTSAADGYIDNVNKGAYLELDELLQSYGKDILDVVHEYAFEGVKVKGKIYGVPTNKEIDNGVSYIFNKELVDKYKFDVTKVKELKDLEPMLQTIKENEAETTPAYIFKGNGLTEGDIPGWHTISNYIGYVKLDDDTLTVQNVLSEEFGAEEKERYTILRDWFEKGYINQDAETAQLGPWKAWGNKTMWVKKDITKPYRAEELKSLFGPEVVVQNVQDVVVKNTQGAMMAISRTSQNSERAMMALNLIYADAEIYNTLVYGIEGVNYEVVKESPKTIKRIKDSGYNYDISWRIGNQFNSYLLEGEAEDKWEKFAEYNSSATKSPILGFAFDPTNVANEIAQINNIYEEYWRGLNSGTRDVETTIAERNNRLKTAGIEKVTAEIQKQLDEWKASK